MANQITKARAIELLKGGAELVRGSLNARYSVVVNRKEWFGLRYDVAEGLQDDHLVVYEGYSKTHHMCTVYVWMDTPRGQAAVAKRTAEMAAADKRRAEHEAQQAELGKAVVALNEALASQGIKAVGVRYANGGISGGPEDLIVTLHVKDLKALLAKVGK